LHLLQAIIFHHNNQFQWKSPPYEYEWEKLPMDMILGNQNIRRQIENIDDIESIRKGWESELNDFLLSARKFYLYE
jgi:uncharacterized protein YbbC (DUF1343 family)